MADTQLTPEELRQIRILSDPVLWAEHYLRNPENPEEPMRVRWYQKKILRYKGRRRVLRMGRRVGKSVTMISDMLYKCFTKSNTECVLICPAENQIKERWDDMEKIARSSPIVDASIQSFTKQPFAIKFGNGSKITGYTAGVRSGSKAMTLRGVGGTDIYLDECDYLDDDSLNAIMPLYVTRKDTSLMVSSTPSGKRSWFFMWCTNKDLGWEEFYHPSSHSPAWLSIKDCKAKGLPLAESTEFQCRSICTPDQYDREYDANFGEESDGVFKHGHINECIHRYKYSDLKVDPDNKYVLGVDWNGSATGTQIVMLEFITEPAT